MNILEKYADSFNKITTSDQRDKILNKTDKVKKVLSTFLSYLLLINYGLENFVKRYIEANPALNSNVFFRLLIILTAFISFNSEKIKHILTMLKNSVTPKVCFMNLTLWSEINEKKEILTEKGDAICLTAEPADTEKVPTE